MVYLLPAHSLNNQGILHYDPEQILTIRKIDLPIFDQSIPLMILCLLNAI